VTSSILETDAAVVAPEFGARIEHGEIGELFGEASRAPFRGASL
jgi:hypothetical protein